MLPHQATCSWVRNSPAHLDQVVNQVHAHHGRGGKQKGPGAVRFPPGRRQARVAEGLGCGRQHVDGRCAQNGADAWQRSTTARWAGQTLQWRGGARMDAHTAACAAAAATAGGTHQRMYRA